MTSVNRQLTNFHKALSAYQLDNKRKAVTTLQLNLGKKCNQVCVHCHVDAGPHCEEMMSLETIDRILTLLDRPNTIQTVDITGGAPELNPHFKYLIKALRQRGYQVIDRCNLTVLFEPGQEATAAFLAAQQVRIVASLPCYLESNVDAQRGGSTYEKSIKALQMLNELGYGSPETNLSLSLVFNPSGIGLPPAQGTLEQDYKKQLWEMHRIRFNHLLTITNMPIKRFKATLKKNGQLAYYESLLEEKFNPEAAKQLMCRELISISWDGQIYDCDFNQALNMPVQAEQNIWHIDVFASVDSPIVFGDHCYGCTAGSGSSCGGALI